MFPRGPNMARPRQSRQLQPRSLLLPPQQRPYRPQPFPRTPPPPHNNQSPLDQSSIYPTLDPCLNHHQTGLLNLPDEAHHQPQLYPSTPYPVPHHPSLAYANLMYGSHFNERPMNSLLPLPTRQELTNAHPPFYPPVTEPAFVQVPRNIIIPAHDNHITNFSEKMSLDYMVHSSLSSPPIMQLNARDHRTIVLENVDDILEVTMGEDSDVSLGHLSRTSTDSQQEQHSSKLANSVQNNFSNISDISEDAYWQMTQDVDDRFRLDSSDLNPTFVESIDSKGETLKPPFTETLEEDVMATLNMHRRLSRKKFNKLKRKHETVIFSKNSDESNQIEDSVIDIDFDDLDAVPTDKLLALCKQLKEELTSLDKTENEVMESDEMPVTFLNNLENVTENEDDEILMPTDDHEEDERLKAVLTNSSHTFTTAEEHPQLDIVDQQPLTQENGEITQDDEIVKEILPFPSDISLPPTKSTTLLANLNEYELRESLIRAILERRAQPPVLSELDSNAESDIVLKVDESKVEPEPKQESETVQKHTVDQYNELCINNNNQHSVLCKTVESCSEEKTLSNTKSMVQTNQKEHKNWPKIDMSRYRLVIELSDEDSDSSQPDEPQTPQSASPLRRDIGGTALYNLPKSQQEEYRKLKREIERREARNITGENLRKYEEKLLQSVLHNRVEMNKHNKLKLRCHTVRRKLKNARIQVRKYERLLKTAQKEVDSLSYHLQVATKLFVNSTTTLKKEVQTVERYKHLCHSVGTKLFGSSYTLPSTVSEAISQNKQQLVTTNKASSSVNADLIVTSKESGESSSSHFRKKVKSLLKLRDAHGTVLLFEQYISFNFGLFKWTTFYRTANYHIEFNEFSDQQHVATSSAYLQHLPQQQVVLDTNSGDSLLQHFKSYRFASYQNFDISSDFWSNALNPHQFICVFDLFGVCKSANCQFQHQKDYIYSPQEKVLDVLTFLSQKDFQDFDVEKYKDDPAELRNALATYVKNKLASQTDGTDDAIEAICKYFARKIQTKTKISSFLIRCIPQELVHFVESAPAGSGGRAPFDDYHYRFNLKDDFFHVRLSKHYDSQVDNDPDSYLRNRFFAPEGVPFSAQLETALATDPHDVQMWIKLAYCYLAKFRDGEQDMHFCIDSALNVLSRALEANHTSAELYEQYLLFYSNKLELLENENLSLEGMLSVEEISRRVLKHCSTFRLWICHLSLCNKLSEKENIIMQLLTHLAQNQIPFDSAAQQSHSILEVLLYQVHLLLQLNKHQQAVCFLDVILGERSVDESDDFHLSSKCDTVSLTTLLPQITAQHRVFLWLCYMHLLVHRCLPYHCFQLCNKGCYLQLVNTSPFVFDWSSLNSMEHVHTVERILNRAISNCCPVPATDADDNGNCQFDCAVSSCSNSCFPLRFNLIQLHKLVHSSGQDSGQQLAKSYCYLATMYSDNHEALNHLHILQLFDLSRPSANDSSQMMVLNLIENFYNSYHHNEICQSISMTDQLFSLMKQQVKFNYWLAFYHYKFNNHVKCRHILAQSISYYYDQDIVIESNNHLQHLYELVLFEEYCLDQIGDIPFDHQHNIKKHRKFTSEKRIAKLVYLYLSYLLIVHLDLLESGTSVDAHYLKLDCVFSSIINSFSTSSQTGSNEHKFLWLNYLLLLLDLPYSVVYFKSVYETLRLICVTFNSSDPLFIYHLTEAFSQLIVERDQLYFLVELAKLNSDNVNLINKTINVALQQSKKETCWHLINYLVFEKKTRLQCYAFWQTAISLSIERHDHLNTHKFFQIAISLMPFNVQLWEMLINYEKSVEHKEHIAAVKHFCQHTIGIDEIVFAS